LPRALCTPFVFWRIFDPIVLRDFQSIVHIAYIPNITHYHAR
jgi:hypothetical protein